VDFLEVEIEIRGLDGHVSVAATGCQAHCESGPTMVVYPGPVYYQDIDKGRLERIIREHFIGESPVKEYFWTGVRRRILADGRVIVPRAIRRIILGVIVGRGIRAAGTWHAVVVAGVVKTNRHRAARFVQ